MDERAEAIEKAKKVKFVILDIHGILTDNTLYYTQDGIKSEAFSLHDRLGHQGPHGSRHRRLFPDKQRYHEQTNRWRRFTESLRKCSGALRQRWRELDEFEKESGYKDEDICYVGDEMIDLGSHEAGRVLCGACRWLTGGQGIADHVLPRGGGKGVVRELAQFILKAQGKWDNLLAQFK